jgi:hypothetical protein
MMGPIEDKLLPGIAGTVVVIAWAIVLAIVGVELLKRRDVS